MLKIKGRRLGNLVRLDGGEVCEGKLENIYQPFTMNSKVLSNSLWQAASCTAYLRSKSWMNTR